METVKENASVVISLDLLRSKVRQHHAIAGCELADCTTEASVTMPIMVDHEPLVATINMVAYGAAGTIMMVVLRYEVGDTTRWIQVNGGDENVLDYDQSLLSCQGTGRFITIGSLTATKQDP
jgi:hypothetical protein